MKVLFDRMNGAVKPLADHIPADRVESARIKGLFAESLLSCDGIVIPLPGIALEVPTLLRWLSLRDLERLIHERTIEFAYVPGSIAYLSAESKKGLQMVAGPGLEYFVNRGTKEEPLDYSSIYDNVEFALKKQTDLSRTDRRRLTRLISDKNIEVDSKSAFHSSLEKARCDAVGPIGKRLGLNAAGHPDEGQMDQFRQAQYVQVAHGNLAVYISAATSCNELICDPITSDVLNSRIQTATTTVRENASALTSILEYEGIPNMEDIFKSERMKMCDILDIRDTKAGGKFREFLASLDDGSPPTVIREYVEASANEMFPDTASEKAIRLIVYAGITIALSQVHPVAGMVAGISKDAFDIYFYDKLKKGLSPRELVSNIERRV